LAQVQPVVLLVEDAQYADAGLLDFLDHLVDWARDIAVFILVFSRPELELARPGFGAGRNRTALALDPLDPASMEQLLEALVPGLPSEAMRAIGQHAQGIPLFAVETVRSLIDRDIVQPREGAYALVSEVGELEVPDSLHALLAARLDALDRASRALVADAAVLGGNFPEEALVAVSQAPPDVVRAALSDLVRRDLLEISADALSPQLGTYRFTHDMLRQVAYDTLSRRDRKARHLAVAQHLRSAFAGDGDEVVEVIAQHYLDALSAVPHDDDTEALRAETVALLERAGTRAVRTGSPASAVVSFVTAAELAEEGGAAAGDVAAARLWESAARAALSTADWDTAAAHACHAAGLLRRHGHVRRAARAEVVAGRAQASAGRVSEGHELLSGAVDVLRGEPDADLVEALASFAAYNVLAGMPGGDDLSVEALRLGQALDVGEATLADLLVTRGLAHALADRNLQAVMYYREAARRAEEVEATPVLIRALVNLSNSLGENDAAASVTHARLAAQHARRLGERWGVSIGVANQVIALIELGNWDEAAGILRDAVTNDGLDDQPHITQYSAVLHALRGEVAPVRELLERTDAAAPSEDPQELALVTLIRALLAHAEGDSSAALLHARSAVGFAHVLGIRCETSRWAWPLAARAAYELDDDEATQILLDMLDRHPGGHLPPLLRVERDLARARLRGSRQREGGADLLAEAVTRVRMLGSPYHLAHALLDQALTAGGGSTAPSELVGEAQAIAHRLGARPLLERAERVRSFVLQAAAT
jgi:tetratricopeptide (TPR) repeat protein